jgi:hypothetical protein
MLENIIEFSTQEDYFELKEDYPIPAKLIIPDWFKELDHSLEKLTVKGCMPFLDALSAGYILKMPQDFAIKHNIEDNNGEKALAQFASARREEISVIYKGLNINNNNLQIHSVDQLGKCPYNEQNKNLPYHKILNPWIIKTPPGYSCLFVPILNNGDDRFFPLSGIVDTDTFKHEINFPIVINGYKYPVLDTIIKKGTPYVQIIPFKRENWKAKFSKKTTKELFTFRMNYALKLLHNYKSRFWNKKSWK